jgi:hypothetical protein
MERFHATPWQDRSKLIDGFEDSRYRELAERLICAHEAEGTPDQSLQRYNTFISQRLSDKGPWLNIDNTLSKIEEMLKKEEDKEKKNILHKLEKKLKKMAAT